MTSLLLSVNGLGPREVPNPGIGGVLEVFSGEADSDLPLGLDIESLLSVKRFEGTGLAVDRDLVALEL